ncbi:CBM20 domain-containing protein [Niabella ginsengisoli]|uniref:Uncharacterized protein n=1 Tax=Niabella ginsengisoli TaxID=522298 RepID=A0ABS9SRE1_9BACT|nr:hypothetical protein [Niabella ginsengisoli]MCH5600920.1 hypothetical protein [Niabella ginsengisoli]
MSYKYIFKDAEGVCIDEFQQPRQLVIDRENIEVLNIYDTWNYAGAVANTFYTAPFQEVLLPRHKAVKVKYKEETTHVFKIKAPLLGKDEVVCLLGDGETLKCWDIKDPIVLNFDGMCWFAALNLKGTQSPFAYKYGIFNKAKKNLSGLKMEETAYVLSKLQLMNKLYCKMALLICKAKPGAGAVLPFRFLVCEVKMASVLVSLAI